MQFNLRDAPPISANPTTALIFLDETGDESINDPNYPVFGFGGCCVLANDYQSTICLPWKSIKKDVFHLDETKPFHSCDIRITREHEPALQTLFYNVFGRFAAIAPKGHMNESNVSIERILFQYIHHQIADILKWTKFSDIIFIYEHSERLIKSLNPFYQEFILQRTLQMACR